MKLAKGFDLAKLVGDGRIATGEVKSVPVGRYAMAALEKLGIWASVEKRMAMVENVRVALTLVARGEAPLGIVYETDAKVEPGVKIVGALPGRLASRDRLPGRRDRQSQSRGARATSISSSRAHQSDLREIWLQLPGEADVVTRPPA